MPSKLTKIFLLLVFLLIPLVSAEPLIGGWYWYDLGENESDLFEIEYYNLNEYEVYGEFKDKFPSVNDKCIHTLWNINEKLLRKIRLIRVWDNHPKEGQPAGVYFLSNIIHIYDGCRNPNTLFHELAHLDRQSIKHDSWFWLSYYRIK